jgi:hypothetical protein
MNTSIKALLVFCEGPHDLAYVRMVLRKLMGFDKLEVVFSKLPSPFHKLFAQSVSTHAAQDLSLDMSHKFFLPDSILKKANTIVALYNCGGKDQHEKIKELLSDYLLVFPQARIFAEGAQEVVDAVKYLFLYDADAEGLNGVLANIEEKLHTINDKNFITDDWSVTDTSSSGKVSGDKAVFVWGETSAKGTLEDILYPMFKQDNELIFSKASTAIDDLFSWNIIDEDPRKAVPEIEKRHKSILTVAGQRRKPGSSMNVVIEQSKLLSVDTLSQDLKTKEFVAFVTKFTEG